MQRMGIAAKVTRRVDDVQRVSSVEDTPYDSIYRMCEGHIECFRDDLIVHDLNWLTRLENAGVPFIHASRKCGTHLLPMYPENHAYWPPSGERVRYLFGSSTREGILEQMHGIKYIAKSENTVMFIHFDGRRCWEVSADKALQIMNDHRHSVMSAWSKRP